MDEFLTRIWENLGGRVGGAMPFRLLLQPAVASFMAVRAGLADLKAGRRPYNWALVTDRTHRRALLLEGWKSIAKVFVMAVVVDFIYQMRVLRWFYPLEALIVAFLLACVPYLLIRGPLNRLIHWAAARRMVRSE